jgi:tetratricopeptide (TPR) repeat protein
MAAEKLGLDLGRGGQLTNIGNVLHNMARYQEAIVSHKRALKIGRTIRNKTLECKAIGNLGQSYERLGHHQQAIRYYKRAINISQASGDKISEARNLSRMSVAYKHLGELVRRKITVRELWK